MDFSGRLRVGNARPGAPGGRRTREIQEAVNGADWSPDGSEMAVVNVGKGPGARRLEFPLGSTVLESKESLAHPRVSPRGDLVAIFEWRGWPCAVVVVDRKGGRRPLTRFDYRLCSGLAWSPAGREVWFTAIDPGGGASLRAVTLEGRERVVHAMPGRLGLRDISPRGDVLLAHGRLRCTVRGLVPGAEEERDFSWLGNSFLRDLSPDGATLILGDWASAGGMDAIFLRRADGSPAVRLGDGGSGKISPDGKWVLTIQRSPPGLLLLPTGAGQPRKLPPGRFEAESAYWFPDGKRILAYTRPASSWSDWVTWTQDVAGGPQVPVLKGYAATLPSPDGRFVLGYAAGQRGIFLCAIDGGSCRPIPGLKPEADEPLRWSPDGRSLFVIAAGEDKREAFARIDLSTGRRETLATLDPGDPIGSFGFGWASITPDGRFYAYSFGWSLSDLYLVKGLR